MAAVVASGWAMHRSSRTGQFFWQRVQGDVDGSSSTYEPPLTMRTIMLNGFARGPRDTGRWRLDQLDETDRNTMWRAAAMELGLRPKRLPDGLESSLSAVRAALKELDLPTLARSWVPEVGSFVFNVESPALLTDPSRVWTGHSRFTNSTQWTARELMPNPVIQRAYDQRQVPTLAGGARKLGSAASPLEGMHLYHLARQYRVKRSLEVGMACGMSTLYILQGILDGHEDAVRDGTAVGPRPPRGFARPKHDGTHHPEAKRVATAGSGAAAPAAPGAVSEAAGAATAAAAAAGGSDAPADAPAPAPAAAPAAAAAAAASAAAPAPAPAPGVWRPADEHHIPEERFAKLGASPSPVMERAARAAAAGCLHISVDPFQETQWEGAARSQVHLSGLSPLSSHIQRPSHIAMPAVEAELGPESLDLVFVDGMHLFDYTLVDLFCADRLLRVGGLVGLDDIQHAGVEACVEYIEVNFPHWRRLRGTACDRTAATWLKVGPDVRKWNDHVGFIDPARHKEHGRKRPRPHM
ncbi:hypothetical protein FNF27_03932 [Cafeteria roenbergensis]|uniref:Methyltransferase domain-containing protein n=1 Tax=Cafeteria roenbergensis TaxID=33653 RepID=A0A5A8EBE0_CAFRO|nr:hypothetical protein FNF27_03932 [Cafeteria roenbergensis]